MLMEEFDPLFEMSWFRSRTTGLPTNIEVWARTETEEYGHSRHQVKIKKDNKWAAIFLVSQNPRMVKNINDSLLPSEIGQIESFIRTHKSALINLIDNKIDSTECGMAIMKKRGEG